MVKKLINQTMIKKRVKELAYKLDQDYADKKLRIIIISNGAIIFGADLVRKLSIQVQFDTLSAVSYVGKKSNGKIKIFDHLKIDIVNKDVLVIDDIFDTGHTLESISSYLMKYEPKTIKTCVLLNKKISRDTNFFPNYTGFTIENYFVVGYGLDFNENYRNLPFIGIF